MPRLDYYVETSDHSKKETLVFEYLKKSRRLETAKERLESNGPRVEHCGKKFLDRSEANLGDWRVRKPL
jgi:hypothetical protein